MTLILKDVNEITKSLIMHHNHSRRNDLSAMPEYSSVRVNGRGVIGATRCNIVVQAGESTRTVLDAIHCLTSKGVGGVSIDAELVTEDDSPQSTCEAALRALSNGRAVGGIYNVTGQNQGLAQAIGEMRWPRRPLYITHELHEATKLFLRSGVIDFLITENLESIMNVVRRFLIGLRTGTARCGEINVVPTELISKFNLQSRTGL